MQQITERTTARKKLVNYAQLDVPYFFNSLMKKHNMDEKQLAVALNVNKKTIKNIMKGEANYTERLIRGLFLLDSTLTASAINISQEAQH